MRIGISTSVIQRGRTGIAQYLFALLRSMLANAPQHEFVLFVLEEDVPLFDFAQSRARIVPVPERFRPAIKNIAWHQTRLPALARAHELDVLHVPSYRRLLWPRPCPLVATIHDLAPFHVAGKYDWKRMLYGRVIARRLAHRQDHIIAISENTARDITRFFGVPRSRISVIHNGLDHARFHPGPADATREQPPFLNSLDSPFFLYVARLEHPGKNHVRLIDAFNRFKASTGSQWHLVLGGADWHGSDLIHAAARLSPFASQIHLPGFVSDEQLPCLYRAAGAFVYPSLYEGFGMPPIEAMACGCPVISSPRGSLGEVVGDAAAIVDPESVESIVRQLAAVATDDGSRARLRAAGFSRAASFDWNQTALATLDIYESTAANHRNCLNAALEMSHG